MRNAGRTLEIAVTNPLPTHPAPSQGNHHAQGSIALRLAHRFGARARMTAGAQDGYYSATLTVPLD